MERRSLLEEDALIESIGKDNQATEFLRWGKQLEKFCSCVGGS